MINNGQNKISLSFIVKLILYFPAWLSYKLCSNTKVRYELNAWATQLRINKGSECANFIWLFRNKLEYRSLLYFRLGFEKTRVLRALYPCHPVLYIATEETNIEEGLILQHGHSTIIHADHIGLNCQVWQNVTIGKAKPGGCKPHIGDNVKIFTGAVVVGNIRIGNNVVIGANTVVNKSVPDNCTVVGNPAKIVKRDGIRIDEKL